MSLPGKSRQCISACPPDAQRARMECIATWETRAPANLIADAAQPGAAPTAKAELCPRPIHGPLSLPRSRLQRTGWLPTCSAKSFVLSLDAAGSSKRRREKDGAVEERQGKMRDRLTEFGTDISAARRGALPNLGPSTYRRRRALGPRVRRGSDKYYRAGNSG